MKSVINRYVLPALLLAMVAGCLWSRALLSVAMTGFIGASCIHRGFLLQCRKAIQQLLPVSVMLLFLVPLATGLWSGDKNTWGEIMLDKLPFFFLPLACCREINYTQREWQHFTQALLALVLVASIRSAVIYLQQQEALDAAYLQSKTIPVPVFNDHIRFSWIVCISMICSLYLAGRNNRPVLRVVLYSLSAWFLVYLHLLAARTGLLSAYCFLLIYAGYVLFSRVKIKGRPLVIAAVAALVCLCWMFFPTLQNRFRYMRYNIQLIKTRQYLPHSNDGNRVLSWQAGLDILHNNPWGAGAGDMNEKVSAWYQEHTRNMPDDEKIFPANEWLIYGGMAGWPGMLLFTLAMVVPLWTGIKRKQVFFTGIVISAWVACLFDSSLEVQAGIFIYAFSVLYGWLWCSLQPAAEKAK